MLSINSGGTTMHLLLTYSIEQSPLEPNRFAAIQEIPRNLRNPKVYYRSHKCPTTVPIMSQFDPVHTPKWLFLKIDYNIFPSTPGLPEWSLSRGLPHQSSVYVSPLPRMCYMPRPSHSSRFYHPNSIGWGLQIIKLLIMKFSQLPCYHSIITWFESWRFLSFL
jgi:hypothetical protein